MIKRIVFLVLLIGWGYIITSFSSQTGGESAGLSERVTDIVIDIFYGDFECFSYERQTEIFDKWHFIVRKCAHMAEYAIFSILVCLFLFTFNWFSYKREGFKGRGLISAVVFSAVFAAADEYHQSFVEGRGASVTDVGIDTAGAVMGALCVLLFLTVSVKMKRKRE